MPDETNTTTEAWKTISDAPLYSVSNQGRVRRDAPIPHHPPRVLRPGLRKGYRRVVILNANFKKSSRQVSRLVAIEFLNPDPDRPFVNHKNGIKCDDRIENLEWVTQKENVRHAYDVLGVKNLVGEAHGMSKLTDQSVREIRNLLQQDLKQRDIARMFNINQRVIWMIKHNLAWRHVTS